MINRRSNYWKTIEIKADLLCLGVSTTDDAEEFYSSQNPYSDWKTGNVGLQILLNDTTHVLATISHRFDKTSPYVIRKEDGYWKLFKEGVEVAKISMVPMPAWYDCRTSSQKSASEIFLHEGRSFMHMEYIGCDYFRMGKSCKFCGTGGMWKVATPKEIGEVVEMAFRESDKYQVCLGGGTRLPLHRNTDYFLKCLSEIRERNNDIPVFIEIVPPETNEEILELVNAGATSFGFNIEIWDDRLREEICPGKSFITRQRYLEAMEYSLELLGPNKVGSCLIVGLEPSENSIRGTLELASRGIQPCILPFKPWDGSVFNNRKNCNPEIVLRVGEKAAQYMLKYGINPHENHGCLNCEGCTVEHDILELMKRGGDMG